MERLRNLKIGPRILVGFSFATILTLVVALVSISYLRSVGQRLATVAEEDRLLQRSALELRIAVAEESDGVRGYLLSGDESLLGPFIHGRSQFERTSMDLRNLVQSETDQNLLSEIDALHSDFLRVAEEQIVLHSQGFPQAAAFLWQLQGNDIKGSLDGKLSDFITRQEEIIVNHTHRATSDQNQAVIISLALVAVALIIGTVGGVWITRSITTPLAHLADTATKIQEGDLSQVARVEREDEVGIMARAFNSMTAQLRALVGYLERRVADRTHELEQLERLGRAIIDGPPDASALPDILAEYVPQMFSGSFIDICVFPDRILLHHPSDRMPVVSEVWAWQRSMSQAAHFLPGSELPWDGQQTPCAVVSVPIIDVETGKPEGGILLSRVRDVDATASLLPAIQSLAAQVASALHGARVYSQTLAYARVEQELELAGRIQASFLPLSIPTLPGWELTATLVPTRETSGDFYDYIRLPNGSLGILIADVTDKGMGAALYMALSRTLIRTYALEPEARPASVLRAANLRILEDAHAGLFVTAFYGILDPMMGTLTYSNAGHNPPYLLRANCGDTIQELHRTGIPLGISNGGSWEQNTVSLAYGDVLLLYTDGITEAQNGQDEFFGKERLQRAMRANRGCSAEEIKDGLLTELDAFVGDAPQFDDIAAMVIVRSRVAT